MPEYKITLENHNVFEIESLLNILSNPFLNSNTIIDDDLE